MNGPSGGVPFKQGKFSGRRKNGKGGVAGRAKESGVEKVSLRVVAVCLAITQRPEKRGGNL